MPEDNKDILVQMKIHLHRYIYILLHSQADKMLLICSHSHFQTAAVQKKDYYKEEQGAAQAVCVIQRYNHTRWRSNYYNEYIAKQNH